MLRAAATTYRPGADRPGFVGTGYGRTPAATTTWQAVRAVRVAGPPTGSVGGPDVADSATRRLMRWSFSDLVLNTPTRDVLRGSRVEPLTRTEFALLEAFLHHPRRSWSAAAVERVLGFDFRPGDLALGLHGYLRRKNEPKESHGCCTPSAASVTCCARRHRDRPVVHAGPDQSATAVRPVAVAAETGGLPRHGGGRPGGGGHRHRRVRHVAGLAVPSPGLGAIEVATYWPARWRAISCGSADKRECAQAATSACRCSPRTAGCCRSRTSGCISLGPQSWRWPGSRGPPIATFGMSSDGSEYRSWPCR